MTLHKKPRETVEDLDRLVADMHHTGYIHRKRGFSMNEVDMAVASNHMIEEACEYQAACIAWSGQLYKDRDRSEHEARVEEAGDLLGCFLHLNLMAGISLGEIVMRAEEKLMERFRAPNTLGGK